MNGFGGKGFRAGSGTSPGLKKKESRGLLAFLRSLSLETKTFMAIMSIGGVIFYVYFFMKDLPTEIYLAVVPAILLTAALPVIFFSKEFQRLRSPEGRVSRKTRFLTSIFTGVFLLLDILYLSDIFTSGTLFGLKVDLSYSIHFVFLLALGGFGTTVLMMAITEEDLEGETDVA